MGDARKHNIQFIEHNPTDPNFGVKKNRRSWKEKQSGQARKPGTRKYRKMLDDEYTIVIFTGGSRNIGTSLSSGTWRKKTILPNRFPCANTVHTILNAVVPSAKKLHAVQFDIPA